MGRKGRATIAQARWGEQSHWYGVQTSPSPHMSGERCSRHDIFSERALHVSHWRRLQGLHLPGFMGRGCLQHGHIWYGATLKGTVQFLSTYWRGACIKSFTSGTQSRLRGRPSVPSRLPLAVDGTVCVELSLMKTYWIRPMLLFCLLRFCFSCLCSRPRLSSWTSFIVLMKTVCKAEDRRLDSGMPLSKLWSEVPLYFDRLPSFTTAKTRRNALRARLAAS